MVDASGSSFGRHGSASSTPSGVSSNSDSDDDECCWVTSSPYTDGSGSGLALAAAALLFFVFLLFAAAKSANLALERAKVISLLYLTKEWKE